MKWCWNNDDNRHRLLRLCLESIEQWTELNAVHFFPFCVNSSGQTKGRKSERGFFSISFSLFSIEYRFCLSDENNDVKWHKCALKTNVMHTGRNWRESFRLCQNLSSSSASTPPLSSLWNGISLMCMSKVSFIAFSLMLVLSFFLVGFGLFALEHQRNINEFPAQRMNAPVGLLFFRRSFFFGCGFWRQKIAKKESNQMHLHRRRWFYYQMRWKHQW